jgi:hypothetical protein
MSADMQSLLEMKIQETISQRDKWTYKLGYMEGYGYRAIYNKYVQTIEECDVFITVIGYCSGGILATSGKSSLETAYDLAKSANRKVLAYIAEGTFRLPAHMRENDNLWDSLRKFRERVLDDENNVCVDIFDEYNVTNLLMQGMDEIEKLLFQEYATGQTVQELELELLREQILTRGVVMEKPVFNYGSAVILAHDVKDVELNDVKFIQQQTTLDLSKLANELSTLRGAMKKEAQDDEHDIAIGRVAEAEQAAKAGDDSKVAEYLKAAGQWALDVALKIGVPVAVDALKKALGIP